MARDPFADEEPDVESVLDTLGDEDCRAIVRSLEEPMTASDVSERCDVPLSTTYRKLDAMQGATLLETLTEVRADGHHTTRYRIAFEEVLLALEEDRSLDVSIGRPARTADERLEKRWSELRRGI